MKIEDVIGKHLSELSKSEDEFVPEIFILLVKYFESSESHMKTEGLFKYPADEEKVKEL